MITARSTAAIDVPTHYDSIIQTIDPNGNYAAQILWENNNIMLGSDGAVHLANAQMMNFGTYNGFYVSTIA